jgi:actin-like ATPase involved in cell morphogenesis
VRYVLGVDLGTTYTAAAVRSDGHVEVAQLGSQRAEIPSLVFIKPDGVALVGEAAERRGAAEPARLAREFKRRVGDPVPLRLGGSTYSAHALMARLLRGVLDAVSRQQEGPPSLVSVTFPANWGPYKRELLEQAVQLAGIDDVELHAEPEAAAVQFSAGERVQPGEIVAVYDLGGGTFDAAVLRKTEAGFELLGKPAGIEQLGGIDFDHAVLGHVTDVLGPALSEVDAEDPVVVEALIRLRRDCVEAKEALSYDTEVAIPVALPSLHTRVRLNRSEFEAMIAPALTDTVDAMDRALRSANVSPESLRSIVLAGGSSRIPLVSEILSARYGRPLVLDSHPEHSVALGAAMVSSDPAAPHTRLSPAAEPDLRPPPAKALPTRESVRAPALRGEEPTRRSRRQRYRALLVAATAVLVLLVGGLSWTIFNRGDPNGTTAQPDKSQSGAEGAWERKADLPVALEGAAVAAYQDKVWAAGGLGNDEARTKLTTVFIYDPGSNTWTSGPSLPRPISHGSLVATPSNLYFLGGWVQDGGSEQVFKLNPTNTAWIQDVPLPEKRVAGAAAYDGTSIIYAGGTRKGGAATDTVWALRGGRWVEIGRLAQKRQKLSAVSNNVDTVWVLGGRDQQTNTIFGNIDRIYQGHVLKASAPEAAPITPPVDSAAAVRLDHIGMCLLGGETPGRLYNDWWCDESGATAQLPKLNPQRAGLGAARIGQTVYVVGGYGATFQGTTLVEAYTPRP